MRSSIDIRDILDPRNQNMLTPPTEYYDWLEPAQDRMARDQRKEQDWLSVALRRSGSRRPNTV